MRSVVFCALAALACLAASASCRSADAAPLRISPNNPYRSFSVSGYNYGSLQWERDHRGGPRHAPARTWRSYRGWRR